MTKFYTSLRMFLVTAVVSGAALLGLAPSGALAERSSGISSYDFASDANVRTGTFCRLSIDGDTIHEGLCNVARQGDTTVINTGVTKYRIERDGFGGATFWRGRNLIDEDLRPRGSCWVGSSVRYCAK